jgi:hypothetical protein
VSILFLCDFLIINGNFNQTCIGFGGVMALTAVAIDLSGSLGIVFAFCDSAGVLQSNNVKDKHARSKSCNK